LKTINFARLAVEAHNGNVARIDKLESVLAEARATIERVREQIELDISHIDEDAVFDGDGVVDSLQALLKLLPVPVKP